MMHKNLLIAPLDWGLGHATRCVPIINCALELQIPVVLAASERSKVFLQNEFPQLETIEFEGYNIHYPKNRNMNLSMANQAPKIFGKIEKEHRTLKKIIKNHNVGAIISDNRYGVYNKGIHSVFMTHQLNIQSEKLTFLEPIIRKINHSYINKFNELWIPDFEGEENLAGKLSHPPLKTIPAYYLGALSRFSEIEKSDNSDFPKIVVIISGPEPQRSIFEEKITQQLKKIDKTAIIVCGTPEKTDIEQISATIQRVGHLDTPILNQYIANADLIITRPGYSTLMDLSVYGKKALLIPTPGQTEQEFLAQKLSKNRQCYTVSQEEMNLMKDVPLSTSYLGLPKIKSDNQTLKIRMEQIAKILS